MTKRKTLLAFNLLCLLLLVIFLFSAALLMHDMITARFEQNTFDKLAQLKLESARSRAESGDLSSLSDGTGAARGADGADASTGTGKSILPEYAALYAANSDLFGWLKADAVGLDYPVMYSPANPEYYLERDFYGNASISGTPFLNADCATDGNYLLIGGHHMKDGTVFGSLSSYTDADFCKQNPYISFDTLYEHRRYEVMGVLVTELYKDSVTGVFKYHEYKDLSDEAVFNEYVRQVKANSVVDTGVDAVYGDELIALETCFYQTYDGRLVVVAKRVA